MLWPARATALRALYREIYCPSQVVPEKTAGRGSGYMQHEALAPFGLFGLLVALLGLDVVVGDLGFQCLFRGFPRGTAHCSLEEISPERVDLVMVPGAFCPWNCIVAETLPVFLQRVYEAGKIVTGICHAPVALAVA